MNSSRVSFQRVKRPLSGDVCRVIVGDANVTAQASSWGQVQLGSPPRFAATLQKKQASTNKAHTSEK